MISAASEPVASTAQAVVSHTCAAIASLLCPLSTPAGVTEAALRSVRRLRTNRFGAGSTIAPRPTLTEKEFICMSPS